MILFYVMMDSLPLEILYYIISFLNPEDQTVLQFVDRRWYDIVDPQHVSLWEISDHCIQNNYLSLLPWIWPEEKYISLNIHLQAIRNDRIEISKWLQSRHQSFDDRTKCAKHSILYDRPNHLKLYLCFPYISNPRKDPLYRALRCFSEGCAVLIIKEHYHEDVSNFAEAINFSFKKNIIGTKFINNFTRDSPIEKLIFLLNQTDLGKIKINVSVYCSEEVKRIVKLHNDSLCGL